MYRLKQHNVVLLAEKRGKINRMCGRALVCAYKICTTFQQQ